MNHDLKSSPSYFERVWDGTKTFEVRLDDRAYQPGDTVALREFDVRHDCDCPTRSHTPATCAKYSGRVVRARVGHLLSSTAPRGSERGFNAGPYVVFSLLEPQNVADRAPHQAAAGQSAPSTLVSNRVVPSPATVFPQTPSLGRPAVAGAVEVRS
jgi:hypothetical protein